MRGLSTLHLLGAVALVGLVATMMAPWALRARINANEAAAVASLRAINDAEAKYRASCGGGGYAQSLEDLAKPPVDGAASFDVAGLPPARTAMRGYIASVGPGRMQTVVLAAARTCNRAAADAIGSYFAEAHPAVLGSTGQTSYGSDQRGAIFRDATGRRFTAAEVAAATDPVR